MDNSELITKLQEELRRFQDAFERHKHDIDLDTLMHLSEQLSTVTDNILTFERDQRSQRRIEELQAGKSNG